MTEERSLVGQSSHKPSVKTCLTSPNIHRTSETSLFSIIPTKNLITNPFQSLRVLLCSFWFAIELEQYGQSGSLQQNTAVTMSCVDKLIITNFRDCTVRQDFLMVVLIQYYIIIFIVFCVICIIIVICNHFSYTRQLYGKGTRSF